MSSPVIVIATITPQPEHYDAVRQVLREAVPRVSKEEGCEMYQLLESDASLPELVMFERWSSQASFDQHLTGAAFTSVAAQIKGKAFLHVSKLAPVPC